MQLNRPESPCQESEDYRFGDCVLNYIAAQVGCQSFWSNNRSSGAPVATCRTENQLIQYQKTYEQLVQLEKTALMYKTRCLDPCNYMEYKVGLPSILKYICNPVLSPASRRPIHFFCGE